MSIRNALVLLALVLAARAHGALPDLAEGFTRKARCVEPLPVAACLCAGIPCGVLVRLRLPLALVEVVRAPGDSIVAGAAPPAIATASSALSASDNTAEARVWSLSPRSLPGGDSCWSSCVQEPDPDEAPETARRSGAGPASSGCSPALESALDAMGGSGGGSGASAISLAYDSTLDALHWRTGCRDLARALGSGLACLSGAQVGGGCLGAWGALYPRQMRDIGPDPVLHSAKTAVRAISLAHEPFHRLDFAPGRSGRLEQVAPGASACFRAGDLPLPDSSSAMPVRRARDGRHAWAWWQPHLCCWDSQKFAACMAALAR
jgi:hypothetical protein